MNTYELSRAWFDFSFENPEKVKPIHTAIYFFAIEHSNRLGNPDKYAMPTSMAMSALGVHSYNTYILALRELVDWGFITIITWSKNQYSSNIIALSKNVKANTKALSKASAKHSQKHTRIIDESDHQSIDSINKPLNLKTLKPEKGENSHTLSDQVNNNNFENRTEPREILPSPGASPDTTDQYHVVFYEQLSMSTKIPYNELAPIWTRWAVKADHDDPSKWPSSLREARNSFERYIRQVSQDYKQSAGEMSYG
jgi:hypothetical protein